MVTKLDKGQIIYLVTNIYEAALTASSYWDIINQWEIIMMRTV